MNLALSAVGIGIQTAKGSAATEPAFYHGVGDGSRIVSFTTQQEEDPLTTGLPGGTGEFRTSEAVAADFETRAFWESIAAYLYGILGDMDTTGTAAPHTHVITADAACPYLTVFGKKDGDYKVAADCKIDELSLSWDGNGPLKLNVTVAGCTATYDTGFTPTLDESLLEYATGLMGAYTLDFDGAGEDCDAVVLGGTITFKRNISADAVSGSLVPADVREGQLEVEASINARFDDLTVLRLLRTGTTTGTTAAEAVTYGEFSFAWTGVDSDSLTLAATRVAWKADEPSISTDGGPAELTLTGKCYMTSGGTPITATVVNSHASY